MMALSIVPYEIDLEPPTANTSKKKRRE